MKVSGLIAACLAALAGAGFAHAQFAAVSADTRGYIESMAVRSGLRIVGEIKAANLRPGRSADFWFPIGPRDQPQGVLVACDDSCDGFRFSVFADSGFQIGSVSDAAHFVFRPEGQGENFYVRVVLEDCGADTCNVGVAKVAQ